MNCRMVKIGSFSFEMDFKVYTVCAQKIEFLVCLGFEEICEHSFDRLLGEKECNDMFPRCFLKSVCTVTRFELEGFGKATCLKQSSFIVMSFLKTERDHAGLFFRLAVCTVAA